LLLAIEYALGGGGPLIFVRQLRAVCRERRRGVCAGVETVVASSRAAVAVLFAAHPVHVEASRRP
jgi:hypothetical protein